MPGASEAALVQMHRKQQNRRRHLKSVRPNEVQDAFAREKSFCIIELSICPTSKVSEPVGRASANGLCAPGGSLFTQRRYLHPLAFTKQHPPLWIKK